LGAPLKTGLLPSARDTHAEEPARATSTAVKAAGWSVLACLLAALCACSGAVGTPSDGFQHSIVDGGPGADAGPNDAGSGSEGAFPPSAIFYQDVSAAALDEASSQTIGHLAAAGWGSGKMQIDFSITILHAESSVVPRSFVPADGYYTPDCDMTAVPIPPGGNAEGSDDYACDTSYKTSGQGDCHVLVYQGARLYELYNTSIAGGQATGQPFTSLCEVVWDLTRDYWQPTSPFGRGDQCTSADAAGMPIAPLLVTGAELLAGVVPHALRFILPNPSMASGVYVHPATHAGGPSGDPMYPPYGARFRLKASFDIEQLPNASAKAVAIALQKYGMFLDDGGNIPLTMDASAAAYIGSQDLAALQVSDFEVVASPAAPVALTDDCLRTPVTE
jgi:hypothetical protein